MPSRECYTITVQESGKTFVCAPDCSVLSAMIAARCGPVHHGCCGGGCGVCRMRVVSGDYHVFKNMSRAHTDPDARPDIVLTCCIQPRSDLVIAAGD